MIVIVKNIGKFQGYIVIYSTHGYIPKFTFNSLCITIIKTTLIRVELL